MHLRRLLPEPGPASVAGAAAVLAGRDVLALNMIASADGRGAVGGRTAPLGSETDRELFHALRAHADAILVGTGTLRDERYGRWTKDERRRAMRLDAGLEPEPIGVTLTRSGWVPWDIPLMEDPGTRIVVYSGAPVTPPAGVRADVDVAPLAAPAAIVADLRARHGVRSILCEGGPTLNGALLAARVVDELFLTIAPTIAGGDPLTIVSGDLPARLPLRLLGAHEAEDALFLRYAIRQVGSDLPSGV